MDLNTSDPESSLILGLIFGMFPLGIALALMVGFLDLTDREMLIALIILAVIDYGGIIGIYLMGKMLK